MPDLTLNTLFGSSVLGRGTLGEGLKSVRPSVLDPRFVGDPWIDDGDDGASLCLGNYPVVDLAVLPFDLPGCNRLLLQLRGRRPRSRQAD